METKIIHPKFEDVLKLLNTIAHYERKFKVKYNKVKRLAHLIGADCKE